MQKMPISNYHIQQILNFLKCVNVVFPQTLKKPIINKIILNILHEYPEIQGQNQNIYNIKHLILKLEFNYLNII